MEPNQKKRIQPKTMITLGILLMVVVFWAGCKARAQKNDLSTTQQVYADYQNTNLDTIATVTPSKEISAYAVLKEPITEQQIIEIFDPYKVKPEGLRFQSGEGVGGHGFTDGYASFQEAMNEFWEAEIRGAKDDYEGALSLYKKLENNGVKDLKTYQDLINRTEANLQRAENHEIKFPGVSFIDSAANAKQIRDENRDNILFIDAQ